jgi:hypothetical protein
MFTPQPKASLLLKALQECASSSLIIPFCTAACRGANLLDFVVFLLDLFKYRRGGNKVPDEMQ